MKIKLLTECCQDLFKTDEGGFSPILKTEEQARAAQAAGQPVYCACCGEDVQVPEPERVT